MPLLRPAYPGIKPGGWKWTQGLDLFVAYRRAGEKMGFTQEWGLSSSLLIDGSAFRLERPKIASALSVMEASGDETETRTAHFLDTASTSDLSGAGRRGVEGGAGREWGMITTISSGVTSAASKRAATCSASGCGCLMKDFDGGFMVVAAATP